jgi:ABC-2 type transport system permease protein
MSAVTATPAGAAIPRQIPGVPLSRHVKVELRKLTDTRAGKWLLIAIAVITAAAMVIFLFAGKEQDLTFTNFVGVAATPQGFLLPVLGILAVTSEWSQRTGLVTFTLEPSRRRIVYAKLIAIIITGLVFVTLALSVAAVSNIIGSSAFGGDGSWHFGAEGFRDLLMLQLMGLLQGVAFGMILINSAAAIVTSFVLPTAFSILANIVPRIQDAAPWIDLGTAQQPLFDHSMGGDDWSKLAVTTLWWIVLPLAAGVWRLLRSEVK